MGATFSFPEGLEDTLFSQIKLRFVCTEKIQISMKSQHWTVVWHVVYIVYWLHAERGQFFASWISSGIYRPEPAEHMGAVGICPNQRFVVVFPQSQCHCENFPGRNCEDFFGYIIFFPIFKKWFIVDPILYSKEHVSTSGSN